MKPLLFQGQPLKALIVLVSLLVKLNNSFIFNLETSPAIAAYI